MFMLYIYFDIYEACFVNHGFEIMYCTSSLSFFIVSEQISKEVLFNIEMLSFIEMTPNRKTNSEAIVSLHIQLSIENGENKYE